MGSGFLLLYKRFEDVSLAWPRTTQEVADITQEKFRILMLGLNPLAPKIKEVHPTKVKRKKMCKAEKFYDLFYKDSICPCLTHKKAALLPFFRFGAFSGHSFCTLTILYFLCFLPVSISFIYRQNDGWPFCQDSSFPPRCSILGGIKESYIYGQEVHV